MNQSSEQNFTNSSSLNETISELENSFRDLAIDRDSLAYQVNNLNEQSTAKLLTSQQRLKDCMRTLATLQKDFGQCLTDLNTYRVEILQSKPKSETKVGMLERSLNELREQLKANSRGS